MLVIKEIQNLMVNKVYLGNTIASLLDVEFRSPDLLTQINLHLNPSFDLTLNKNYTFKLIEDTPGLFILAGYDFNEQFSRYEYTFKALFGEEISSEDENVISVFSKDRLDVDLNKHYTITIEK